MRARWASTPTGGIRAARGAMPVFLIQALAVAQAPARSEGRRGRRVLAPDLQLAGCAAWPPCSGGSPRRWCRAPEADRAPHHQSFRWSGVCPTPTCSRPAGRENQGRPGKPHSGSEVAQGIVIYDRPARRCRVVVPGAARHRVSAADYWSRGQLRGFSPAKRRCGRSRRK